ncbi:class I SAM-dependent methyltransferase [Gracilibacillus caseinilyticus]|uniref:class I SAM-dependent methyltransferase n=1 Tax=Gracilibacillus caseinilyticus TaxID=2932256 RepID=UPI003510AB7F
MNQLPLLKDQGYVRVLDLGCGVGRNSIPIAQRLNKGTVVCVDLLPSAIEKLEYYSHKFEVEEFIESVRSDIGNYTINENEFDLIIAVSSLEHLVSEDILEEVL